MSMEGDYPAVVWEYADAVAGDGIVVGGRLLTVEESYRRALGCPASSQTVSSENDGPTTTVVSDFATTTVTGPVVPLVGSTTTGSVAPLVVESTAVGTIPGVIVCRVPDGTPESPNRGATITDGTTHATPEDALAAFLVSLDEVSPPIAVSGYIEMTQPDGSIAYVVPFNDDIDNGLVTLIETTHTDVGWAIGRWEASGC